MKEIEGLYRQAQGHLTAPGFLWKKDLKIIYDYRYEDGRGGVTNNGKIDDKKLEISNKYLKLVKEERKKANTFRKQQENIDKGHVQGFKSKRNIKKEKEWAKIKYERVLGDIDKKLGLELKAKLKKDGKSIAGWISENAEKYIENN